MGGAHLGWNGRVSTSKARLIGQLELLASRNIQTNYEDRTLSHVERRYEPRTSVTN